jgi:hypothetical protein
LAALAVALVWATSVLVALPQQPLVVAKVMAVQARQILVAVVLQEYLLVPLVLVARVSSSFATQSKEQKCRTSQK